jgi:hypothetical protein
MSEQPDCAVCGRTVESNRAEVIATWYVQNRTVEYVLHDACANRVIGGWRQS